MPNGKQAVAQYYYLAQLQACKGSCQCNVCKLLRKCADVQAEELLNPSPAPTPQGMPEVMESPLAQVDTYNISERGEGI